HCDFLVPENVARGQLELIAECAAELHVRVVLRGPPLLATPVVLGFNPDGVSVPVVHVANLASVPAEASSNDVDRAVAPEHIVRERAGECAPVGFDVTECGRVAIVCASRMVADNGLYLAHLAVAAGLPSWAFDYWVAGLSCDPCESCEICHGLPLGA